MTNKDDKAGGAGAKDDGAGPVKFSGANGPVYVDPSAATHLQVGQFQAPHSDKARKAAGETELSTVTEIGTIGGLIIRVLDDIELVAKALGFV